MQHYHIISRIAIYSLSVVLFCFGIFHFLYPHDLLVFVPAFLPGGISWAYIVGAAFIFVSISFLTNRLVKVSGYMLAVLLIIFILTIHVPNYLNAGDKEMRQMALINILKDTAIVGFALHIAAGAHHQKLHLEDSD
jgi:putative oxidoreductase